MKNENLHERKYGSVEKYKYIVYSENIKFKIKEARIYYIYYLK